MRGVPGWLIAISGIFLVGLLAIVASSFLRPSPEAYPPTLSTPDEVGERTVRGRYTVDARDPDRWVFFDFSRRAAVTDPGPREWDLGLRRFHLIVNGGEGYAGVAGARVVPAGGTEPLELPRSDYVGTRGRLEREATHPVLDEWYDYGFFTHLLTPRPVTYALRTADGRYAAIRIVAYYCPGAVPGCVTFDYAYRGDGGHVLPPPSPLPARRH